MKHQTSPLTLGSNYAAMATIATMLFSIDGFSRIRTLDLAKPEPQADNPTQPDPQHIERVQRVLATAQNERQQKLARRAARHYSSQA